MDLSKIIGSLLCVLGIILTSMAQTEEAFNGLIPYEPLESAHDKLVHFSGQIKRIEKEYPSFPLSRDREDHVVCTDYQTKYGKISEVVFTFSDGKLVFIQARGNAIASLTDMRKDTAQKYLDYEVYWKDHLFTKPKEDKVWILSPEAAHPNLFFWDNPYLPSNGGEAQEYKSSVKIPECIQMGGDLEHLRPKLQQASKFTNSMELDGSDPHAQFQIDCFGIEYAGFPRKFEARFGDGKLNAVWILTGKGEEERIRKKLIQEFGPVIFVNEAWEVFNDWQVMLRKDKPEILLVTEELGNFYKSTYFKQD